MTRREDNPPCQIDGCERTYFTAGYCDLHYKMFWPKREHAQRFLIVGYFDFVHKWAGNWQITYLRDEDRFTVSHVPTRSQMADWARIKGYKVDDPKRYKNEAQAVYLVIGEGLDWLQCPECFRRSCKAIDDRKATQ